MQAAAQSSAFHFVFLPIARVLGCSAFVPATGLLAQTTPTGTLTGRVLNVATNHGRNAEFRVQGTTLTATTEDGGFYRLEHVPVGMQTVAAIYPGAELASATINVTAGATASWMRATR